MTRQIVVLTGAAGVGKTTIAERLVAHHGFERVRFAGPLKAMCRAMGLTPDEIDGALKDKPSSKLTLENLMLMLCENAYSMFGTLHPAYHALKDDEPAALLGGKTPNFAETTFLLEVLKGIDRAGPEGATPRTLMQIVGTEWGRDRISKTLWSDAWRAQIENTSSYAKIVVDDCRFPNEEAACIAMGDTTFFRVLRNAPSKLSSDAERKHESESHVIGYHFVVSNNSTPEAATAAVVGMMRETRPSRVADVLATSFVGDEGSGP